MSNQQHNDGRVTAGVIGVGSMGANHARIYDQLHHVDLVGVSDMDTQSARRVAERYDTQARPAADLLERVDLVSVAVPTHAHATVVADCLDAGVHVLVEKPFVDDPDAGWDLVRQARQAGLTLQVGHVERFNPAIQVLPDILEDLDVIAVDARRLGPPLDSARQIDDSVVRDLMIHDLDVVASLLDSDVQVIAAAGTPDGDYASAVCRLGDVTASFTASRLTQRKVRQLNITTAQCFIDVDYAERRIELHRRSRPAYVADNGDIRHRIESVVEHPMVRDGEPLRLELESFVEAVRTGDDPVVTGEDGIRAVEVVNRIEETLDAPVGVGVGRA